MDTIVVSDLCKSYGHIKALDSISFEIPVGKHTGIIGQNGAGKSTFIKSFVGITTFDSGRIVLPQFQQQNQTQNNLLQAVAYLPEKFTFYPDYSVENLVTFFYRMYHPLECNFKQRLEAIYKDFDLTNILKQKIKTLSKGTLQRVALAGVLSSDAPIIILDEPFSGLDPIHIKEIKDVIKRILTKEQTLITSSHILSEVEKSCEHIVIINKGKQLFQGSIDQIDKSVSLEDFFYNLVKNSNS